MSDANLTKIVYGQEAEFGVVPASPPTLQEVRFLSSGLSHEKLTEMSQEIRSDRARSKLIEVGKNAAGPLATEFIVGAYNPLVLAALMAAAWVTGEATVTATTSLQATTITLTATAGTFPAAAQLAKFVIMSGPASETYQGIKRVVSMSSTVLVFPRPSGIIAGFVGQEVTVEWNYARNGVTHRSFMVEQQYLGLDPDYYATFLGAAVNQWTVTMEAQARVLQTFQFMATQALVGTSSQGDGSPTAHSTRSICNTTGNIGGLIWDGEAFASNVAAFDFTLGNNLRNRPAISRETTLVHGKGRSEPDGTLSTYFEDPSLLEKFVEHEEASLLLPIIDPDGNLHSFHFPHLEFPEGFPTIEGVNTDVMLDLAFNATIHEELGYIVQVDQLDAPGASS